MSVVCVERGYQWSSVDQCSPLVWEEWVVPWRMSPLQQPQHSHGIPPGNSPLGLKVYTWMYSYMCVQRIHVHISGRRALKGERAFAATNKAKLSCFYKQLFGWWIHNCNQDTWAPMYMHVDEYECLYIADPDIYDCVPSSKVAFTALLLLAPGLFLYIPWT